MHHDDRALLGLQPVESGVEQFAVGNSRSDVADGLSIERQQLDLDRAAATPPDNVDAGSEHQAMQPGLEAIWIAKGWQAAPGREEPVLDRVPRELVVPEDQAGCRVQPRDERAG